LGDGDFNRQPILFILSKLQPGLISNCIVTAQGRRVRFGLAAHVVPPSEASPPRPRLSASTSNCMVGQNAQFVSAALKINDLQRARVRLRKLEGGAPFHAQAGIPVIF
jgi:hypothetical protein